MGVQIFLAVINGDFIAGFNVSQRPDPDAIAGSISLGVRATGVVDIAGCVASRAAIDSALFIEFKEVLPTPSVSFLGADDGADIFNDSLIGWDGL
jgi:hypothetical protein